MQKSSVLTLVAGLVVSDVRSVDLVGGDAEEHVSDLVVAQVRVVRGPLVLVARERRVLDGLRKEGPRSLQSKRCER